MLSCCRIVNTFGFHIDIKTKLIFSLHYDLLYISLRGSHNLHKLQSLNRFVFSSFVSSVMENSIIMKSSHLEERLGPRSSQYYVRFPSNGKNTKFLKKIFITNISGNIQATFKVNLHLTWRLPLSLVNYSLLQMSALKVLFKLQHCHNKSKVNNDCIYNQNYENYPGYGK